MRRDDLLSMTPQDLEGYSNRGTVKRAQKELDKAETVHDILSMDEAGNLSAHWPDGIVTQLAANQVFPNGQCTCPSTTTCRHLITLVLAYQAMGTGEDDSPAPTAWNPGEITDQLIEEVFSSAQIRKAKQWFQEGILAELVIGEKPLAIIESIGVVVRFLVPGDPRYVQSDSDDDLTAVAAIIAILAFRQLPKDQTCGYVSTCSRSDVDQEAFRSVGHLFVRLLQCGLSHLEPDLRDKLRRAARDLTIHDWLWPATHCEHIVDQLDRYARRDGSFMPALMIRHMGEFLCRQRALASPALPVPEAIIKGGGPERIKERSGKSRFVGLGCRMKAVEGGFLAEVFLQSADTGALVVLEKFHKLPKEDDAQRSYHHMAQRMYLLQHSVYEYGRGQVLTSGAKRSLDSRVEFGRKTMVNPQSFQWQNLRQSLLMEDFEELTRRLGTRPAGPFRSLKANENFYVLKVAGVTNPRFNTVSQCVTADLLDAKGAGIGLSFPYSTQGAEGAEALLQLLQKHGSQIGYVAGAVTEHTGMLVVEPVSVVYTANRQPAILQPYVDRTLSSIPIDHPLPAEDQLTLTKSVLSRLLEELDHLVCDLLITGLRHATPRAKSQWQTLVRQCEATGLHQLCRLMSAAVHGLDDTLNVNESALLNLLIYLRLSK